MREGGQFHQQARGDGVGEIGDELHPGFREQRGQVAFEDVGVDKVQAGLAGEALLEVGRETVVLLDGGDGRGAVEERAGQDAEAGADFDDGVGRLQLGGGEEDIEDVAVDQKVLPEDARGMEVELREQGADFGGARQDGVAGHFGVFSGAGSWYLC